jgi:hypothetical protein
MGICWLARKTYKSIMKSLILILALIATSSLEVLAGDNLQTTNSLKLDKVLPVGTSISGVWINTNVVSSIAIRPATNHAGILLPPTGLHVQKG